MDFKLLKVRPSVDRNKNLNLNGAKNRGKERYEKITTGTK